MKNSHCESDKMMKNNSELCKFAYINTHLNIGTYFYHKKWDILTRAIFSPNVMMTSSNGNIFRVTGPLCGEFTGPGEFPTQRPVTRSFDVFFDLRLNKRSSKQPRGWWFETQSWSLWRHYNGALVSQQCTLVVSKDLNSSHYLNLSIYSSTNIVAIM